MAESHSHPNESTQRIAATLQPLADLGDGGAAEFQKQLRALQTVDQKYQAVKSLYATVFENTQKLKDSLDRLKKRWSEEPI